MLATRLALPLRLYLSVHHVGRAEIAGFVRLVLCLLALRQRVLALAEVGLARLHERSSRHVHAGRVVQRVLGPIGQRRGAVEDERPLVQSCASFIRQCDPRMQREERGYIVLIKLRVKLSR